MEFVPMVVLGALVWKFVDFLKALTNKDWNSVVTQSVAWIAGIAAVVLFAHSAFGAAIPVWSGMTLASMGGVEQAIVGLSATSLMSVGYDFKKGLDNSDSAKQPPLTTLGK